MSYLLAVVAAVAYGVNWVLQQHEAGLAPTGLQLHPVRLLEHVIRRPLWLVGLFALIVGAAAQEGALADGSLPVIECLLVLDLVCALLLANVLSHHSVSRSQWLGAAAVCAGLAAFLIAGHPSSGHGGGADPRWVLVLAVVGGLTAALLAAAWRTTGVVRAALCATAASIMFGVSDVLSKAAFDLLDDHGPWRFLLAWQLYGTVAAAIVAVAASQIAYNAARLAVSLPSLAVGEPVTGVLIGIMLLGVHFRASPAALAVEAAGAAAIAWGSWVVARAPVLHFHSSTDGEVGSAAESGATPPGTGSIQPPAEPPLGGPGLPTGRDEPRAPISR